MTDQLVRRVAAPAAAALLALIAGLGFVSLMLTCYLVSLLMPGGTHLRRALYGAVALFATNACVLTLLSVLDQGCSPALLTAGYVLVAAGLLVGTGLPAPCRLYDRHDAWALGLACITASILAIPLVGSSPGEVMTLLSQTTDGGTHVQMVLGTARHGGYFTLDPVAGMREGIEAYPGGWAGNVWLLGQVGAGRELTPVGTVRLVAAVAVASYGLLVLLATRLALALADSLRDALSRGQELLVTALVALSTSVGFGLFFLNLNSFTQIVAIAGVLVAVLLLWEGGGPIRTHLMLAATAVVVAQTWYLLAPILAAAVLVGVNSVPAPRRFFLGLWVAIAPIAAFPVLTGPGGHQVSYRGSQLLPTLPGVLGLLLAGAVAVLTLVGRGRSEATVRLAWASTFVAALLLECALLPFRPPDVPGTSYYAGKVLLVLFLLAGIAAAGAVVGETMLRWGRLPAIAIVLGLAAAAWSTSDMAIPPGLGHTQGHVKAAEIDALEKRHPDGLPHATDAWILDGCSRVGDLVASKWMYDLSLTWTAARSSALEEYVYDSTKGVTMLAERASDPSVRTIEVVVERDCQPENIARLARLPKVTVIHVP